MGLRGPGVSPQQPDDETPGMQPDRRILLWGGIAVALVIFALVLGIVIGGNLAGGGNPTPIAGEQTPTVVATQTSTGVSSPAAASPTQSLTTIPPVAQQITIESPPPNTVVGSPVVITGRTARYPFEGNLSYRVLNEAGTELGAGGFLVSGEIGQPATFNGSLTFNAPEGGGTIRVEIFERDVATGNIIANASLVLQVSPPPLVPPTPSSQQITIETPPPNTVVGSPVVITGRTARYPINGSLSYRVLDAVGKELSTGGFQVAGQVGAPSTFNASITFPEPAGGGAIRVEIFERDPATGTIAASTTTPLRVAAPPPPQTATPVPQQITIESPPPGTVVGSPVVITGRTTRYPFEGNLSYRVLNGANQEIGSGSVQVTGQIGQPSTFNASLIFTEPPAGGPITVAIIDRDQSSGNVIAEASIALQVAAPQPTPTTVPTTAVPAATASATRVPAATASATSASAATASATSASAATASATSASAATASATSAPAATASATAVPPTSVPPTAVPPTSVPPTAVPPTPTSFLQQIIVETPRPNAVVSSPFDVEGSTTRYPTGGILHYRVLDSASNELGTGTITVTGQTGQPTTFSASLTFTEPEGGGAITLEISDRDQATGGYIASARVSLTTE